MKLKFRADAKDIVIFLIFCGVLLYFVALGILNLHQFSIDATFHGVNPVKAFTGEFIGVTIMVFILALIMILTSVSSYFFDMEEGIGIIPRKKEKRDGYSKWAKEEDIKKGLFKVKPEDETSEHAGIVLINNDKGLWVDDSEYHNLIIGATGSGKTQLVVLPMVKVLAKKGESMIITDPKGEIYANNAEMLKEKGYNVIVLNFRNPDKGSAWNPLMLPYMLYKSGDKDKAMELLDDLAINVLYSEKSNDPFWEESSASYFIGLALALFEDAKDASEVNFNSINLMSTIGEDRYRASTYLKEYFNYKDPSSAAYTNISTALFAPNETKGSILSVFKSKIKIFSAREKMSEMLSHSSIDMKSIGREKTAVFLVIQDEKKTYHPLVTTFIKQVYETLIDVAQETDGKLKYRTNFILDEFANMPPLKDVTTMVTAARSRKMRFTFIIQNFSQLYQVYGKENGETIKGNCGNILYLISSELSALEEISKLAGEKKSKEKDKTSSTPLITVSDLQRLSEGEAVLLRTRKDPFKVKLKFNYEMNWGTEYTVADFPTRDTKRISLFNLKDYVDKQNEQKMKDLMGGSLGGMKQPSMDVPRKRPAMPKPPGFEDENLDIDELVKKIDAKIAELEAEEKIEAEKEKEEKRKQEEALKESSFKEDSKVEKSIEEELKEKFNKSNIFKPIEEKDRSEKEVVGKPLDEFPGENISRKPKPAKGIVKPKVEVTKPKNEKEEESVTDDQFFDDFFGEED